MEESGNIIKLRKGAGAREARKDREDARRSKELWLWADENVEKKLEKSLKNPLTNGTEYDILNKLSQRAVANGTLKIEQRKTRKQSKERRKTNQITR